MALKRSDLPVKTILLLNGKGMSHELDIVKKTSFGRKKNDDDNDFSCTKLQNITLFIREFWLWSLSQKTTYTPCTSLHSITLSQVRI